MVILVRDNNGGTFEINVKGDCSVYEGDDVPDADFEIALKVIRTVRNCCLGPGYFDADGAVILSHALTKLLEIYEGSDDAETDKPETTPG